MTETVRDDTSRAPTDGRRAPWLLAAVGLLTSAGFYIALDPEWPPGFRAVGAAVAATGSGVLWLDRLRGPVFLELVVHLATSSAPSRALLRPYARDSSLWQVAAHVALTVALFLLLHARFARRVRRRSAADS